jgi:transglutaminase-like putative cysteine protease
VAARTERAGGPASDAVTGTYGVEDPARALALVGGLVLTGTYVSVLVSVTGVVGGTPQLVAAVAAALVVATGMARYLRPRHAAAVGAVLLVVGYVWYMSRVQYGWLLLANIGQALADAAALLTGLSVLRMTGAGVWAVGFAPGPVFLSWYLFVRQRYAAGAGVGGAALTVFVLTGDAGTVVTLAGAAAAATAVGFGEIERRTGTVEQLDTLLVLVAAMTIVGGSVAVVPASTGQPLSPDRGERTVEGGLIASSDRVDVVGSISLSPEVRFTVESEEPAYWRVGAYDRYTGQGWVRSGQTRPASDGLPSASGQRRTVTQRVEMLTALGVMPAAWRPVELRDAPETQLTSLGGIKPATALEEGESYEVVSQVSTASDDDLREAGSDYPDDVEERYTQLPDETPDRVGGFTDEVVAGAATPYEKAVRVERWLEENKGYSLDVDRPSGSVADSFLFEMERGYCTYYATTMVTMLRTEGIPARFVTGYTTGQRVAEDQWVVRALDSHAWVEVYFPDVGWVQFDPTPGGPRSSFESDRLEEARDQGAEDVDAAGSEEGTWTPTPGPDTGTTDGTTDPVNATPTADGSDGPATPIGPTAADVTPPAAVDGSGSDGGMPARELLGFALVVVLGAAAAVRRSGVGADAYELANIQFQGARRTPRADVERAAARLETLLSRRHRERRPGESRAQYLEALSYRGLDDRALRVGEVYERARYGGGVTREEADEAVGLVDEMVRSGTPLVRRFR